jgi:hypothetical protein
VLQTSHSRKPHCPGARRRLWHDSAVLRRILLQTQMTTVLVIIGDEFMHHAVKLRLVEHDDFIQQLSA